jgi:type VI secretion system protein ImpF
MPELSLEERLQPSLLDRLTDDEPQQQQESRLQRVLTLHQLRESVLRDLTWLLNTGNLESAEELTSYPYVAQSVVNYGIPDLAGLTVKTVSPSELERVVRQAILQFEPRILPGTVRVRATTSDEEMSHNSLVFYIEGELWFHPLPLPLFLKTEVDLELGNVTVVEQGK